MSSIFIGGHGFFKTYIAFMLLGSAPDISACVVVFLVTFCVYSLDKIADIDKDVTNMPQRHSFLSGKKNIILAYSIGAYALAVIMVLLERPLAIPIIFIPFIANAFYATKPFESIPRLKDIPLVKNIIVAASWALVTTLMPAIYLGDLPRSTIMPIFYFMLVKTFIDNVLYDVRDIKGDKENGIRTMAVILGQNRTAALLLAVNSTLIPWLYIACNAMRPCALGLMLYGYAYTLYFKERRNPLLLDFFVEGEWMLTAILLAGIQLVGLLVMQRP